MRCPFFHYTDPMAKKNEGLTFIEKKKHFSKALLKDILGTVFYCLAGMLIAVSLVVAFGMRTKVVGVSMEPSLLSGQEILVDRFLYGLSNPKRGDIICFYPRGNENSHIYVKRVVGLPFETVEIRNGYVYIDGLRLNESEDLDMMEDAQEASGPITLDKDEYFVLGDNRNNSEDSRNGNIGAVKKDTIIGKAWFKLKKDDNGTDLIR